MTKFEKIIIAITFGVIFMFWFFGEMIIDHAGWLELLAPIGVIALLAILIGGSVYANAGRRRTGKNLRGTTIPPRLEE